MIREAINRIVELAAPNYTEVYGRMYTDKKMFEFDSDMRATPIKLSTLTSLVDYIKNYAFEKKPNLPYMVLVNSPTSVELFSALDDDRRRETLVEVRAEVPSFDFQSYMGNETMLIAVQSKFLDDPDTDKAAVLRFAGTVTSGTIAEYGDDGVTQKATIRQGVASKTEALVPSPCTLRPYRTFIEVEQPASEFIFRMREAGNGVQAALFEADGGAWKIEAKKNIKEYLEKQLEGTGVIVIA